MGHDANEYHPVEIIHDRHGLYASIYRSVGRQGSFFTIQFNRAGYCEGRFVTTHSFRQEHLPTLAQLARRCHDRVVELKEIEACPIKPTMN